MEGEWRQTRLGDLVSLRGGLAYEGRLVGDSGDALVTMGCVARKARFNPAGLKRYSGAAGDAHRLQAGDLVIATRDVTQNRELIGAPAIVPDGLPGSPVLATNMYRVTNLSEVPTEFLYWLLRGPDYREQIVASAKGTTVVMITKDAVENFAFRLPPKPVQYAITHILGTLDEMIELNRRMNETLEALTRALFKSWFVDFDPVRAKAEGRDPGLPQHLADLFPDSFEDSELGEIPSGWETRPLYETARFINGSAFKSDDFCPAGDGLPVIKIAELKDGISAQTKWSWRQVEEDRLIDAGDLLYSWSGSPDTSLNAFLWTKGPGLLNQHIFKVVAPTSAQKRFVYYLLKFLRPILIETARTKQTTGLGHVTVADMKRLLVCWPTQEILAAFNQEIAPIFNRAFATTVEVQTLAALRDTLLPKLISGELRVPDAERFLERVAP